eukprot:TRINITY_DN10246_c0_g1_i3.p1 TRINITY_DN10246_c0_g1~~TRINITY_DN10246_c0_g1_i3.p1  ORF type:complete len:502 (-),score=59.42 TRINITY_DN10246_c0_g1_i3:10-1515(-)
MIMGERLDHTSSHSRTHSSTPNSSYQGLHEEGLLSHQTPVLPSAPLLYEQQFLMSKLRGANVQAAMDKLIKNDPPPPTPPPALPARSVPVPSHPAILSSSSTHHSTNRLASPSKVYQLPQYPTLTPVGYDETPKRRSSQSSVVPPNPPTSQHTPAPSAPAPAPAPTPPAATPARRGKKAKSDDTPSRAPTLVNPNVSVDEADEEGATKGGKRYDSSLGLLTKKFVGLVKDCSEGLLDLNQAADTLKVQKRRIYDITNVLEGIGLIEKRSKNNIQWRGCGLTTPEDVSQLDRLKSEMDRLNRQELALDDSLRAVQGDLRRLAEESQTSSLAFVTHEDIRSLPSMQGETIIAVKAPSGTRLEVPDPDEGMEQGLRRFQIYLSTTSPGSQPIDVYLISQHSETHSTNGDWGPPPIHHVFGSEGTPTGHPASPSLPSTPPLMESAPLLRLSPPHSAVDPEYYLGNMLHGEGISDLYSEESSYIDDSFGSSFDEGDSFIQPPGTGW